MARLAHQHDRCFPCRAHQRARRPTRLGNRRSLALRILARAFATRTTVRHADARCDICHSKLADRIRHGNYAPSSRGPRRPASPDPARGR
jgi:hypothetical protein